MSADDDSDRDNSTRFRYSRRRFLKGAGGAIAGILAVFGAGYWLSRQPRGTVVDGAQTGTQEFLSLFPVRSVESVPKTPADQWTITVDGLVENPLTLDWQAFKALPRAGETVDFHCVEGWSVDHVVWDGVRLATMLEQARPTAAAIAVRFHAAGGRYTDELSLEQAGAPHVVLADTLENVALPPEHGGPVRLVVPDQLGYKSVKWVQRIELVAERQKGYWEQRGYAVEAPIPVEP